MSHEHRRWSSDADRQAAQALGAAIAAQVRARREAAQHDRQPVAPPRPLRADPGYHPAPPPYGIARPVAGCSCGWVGAGHTREVLVGASTRDLIARIAAWRCACGRRCWGEDRR
ncbi:hypothetical protein KF840_21690 [bacterium]|nr:hypothetical protein [bacterium]